MMLSNAPDLYAELQEAMESENQSARNWDELSAGSQIAWGKLFRKLTAEYPPGPPSGLVLLELRRLYSDLSIHPHQTLEALRAIQDEVEAKIKALKAENDLKD